MKKYNQVIFVGADNTKESIMAAAIMQNIAKDYPVKIVSRGLVVLFPEPINPKVLSVLEAHKLTVLKKYSDPFDPSEVTSSTLILTMRETQLTKVKNMVGDKCDCFNVMDYAGKGGDFVISSVDDVKYAEAFEVLDLWIKVLTGKIFEIAPAAEEKTEKQVLEDTEAVKQALTEEYLQVIEKTAARREAAKVEESEYKKLYKEILEKNSKKQGEE